MIDKICFKMAKSESDFKLIHRFNHKIFAEEIAQHSVHDDYILVDKFHAKSKYFIGQIDNEIIGMICVHTEPPFSIEDKYPNFRTHFDKISEISEVRLFAIKPKFRRHPFLAWGLIYFVVKYLENLNINYIAISGIANQRGLYEKLGFYTLSDSVKSGNAHFYPMLLERNSFFSLHKDTILRIKKYLKSL